MSRRDGDELDESASIDAILFPERPGRRRRRWLTRRAVRVLNQLCELPLTLTVGTMLVIGIALALIYVYVCP